MNTKILFAMILTGMVVLSVSCKKDPKSDTTKRIEEPVVDSIAIVKEEVEKEPVAKKKKTSKKKPKKKKPQKAKLPPGTPYFDNLDAQKYVRSYEAYVANYKKAVESNDMDSFLKLSDASSNLSKQYTTLINKLTVEEKNKMSQYMKEKAKQIEKLSSKM